MQIMISCIVGKHTSKLNFIPIDILFPYSQLQFIDKLFVLNINNNTVAFMKSISALGLQAYLYIKPFGALIRSSVEVAGPPSAALHR